MCARRAARAAPPSTADARRTRELAAIHAGRRALGWDEDTYRTNLVLLTGRSSAGDLSAAQRGLVLDRMRELGYGRGGGHAPRPEAAPQIAKIRRLWEDLAAGGALRDSSDAALQAFTERQTGKSRLEWCTPGELGKVIEGLKAWTSRTRTGGGA